MKGSTKAKLEAAVAGKGKYFTGVPCSKGHVAERWMCNRMCVICAREKRRERYEKHGHKELSKLYARQRRAADPAKERRREIRVQLKSKYGITEQQYADIFSAQKGCCAICRLDLVSRLDDSRPTYSGPGAPSNHLARVDHCHDTGRIRGLLCSNCNILLGKARDSEKVLFEAIRYLRLNATGSALDRMQNVNLQGEKEPLQRDLDRTKSRVSRRDDLSPFMN